MPRWCVIVQRAAEGVGPYGVAVRPCVSAGFAEISKSVIARSAATRQSVNALPQSHSRASLKRFGPPMARLRKLRLCFFCPRQRKTAVLPAAG